MWILGGGVFCTGWGDEGWLPPLFPTAGGEIGGSVVLVLCGVLVIVNDTPVQRTEEHHTYMYCGALHFGKTCFFIYFLFFHLL